MAPLLTEEEAVIDPYLVLQVEATVTEQEVRKAYRKLSLKYHPDRNQSADAVPKFREISVALELLLDPAKRAFLNDKLEADRRKKARYADLDKKRKAMVDALNEREEEAKRAKGDAVKRREEEREEERIKREGREMLERAQKRREDEALQREKDRAEEKQREEAEATNRRQAVHANGTTEAASASTTQHPPPIAPADLTLVVQLPPTYSATTSAALQAVLGAKYGPISHLILSAPAIPPSVLPGQAEGKKKKPKGAKAVVEFAKGNWGGCWACWKDHQVDAGEDSGIAGAKVRWAGGEAPVWVAWATSQAGGSHKQTDMSSEGRTNGHPNGHRLPSTFLPQQPSSAAPSFGSAPDFGPQGTTMADLLAQHRAGRSQEKADKEKRDDFESMTLLRMRQRERERLEEQIRKEEEAETA